MLSLDLYVKSEDYSNFKCSLIDDMARKEGAEHCTVLNPKTVTSSILAVAIESQNGDQAKEQELTLLDNWKDNFISAKIGGKYSIQQYYAVSAAMINALEKGSAEKVQELYNNIYSCVVTPCINCIKQNDQEKAYTICREKLEEIFNKNFKTEL